LVSWHRAHYDECAGQANLALLVGNETSVYSGYRWAASLRALALFEVNGDEAGSAAMREAMTSAEREPVPMGSEFLVLARSRSVALTSAAQGFEALVEGWSEIVSAGLDYTLPTVAADLCRDGERFGREGLARQVVADLRQRHQDFGIEWIGALAQHCEGLANRDRHTVARSVVLFEATGREQARSAAFADLVELGGTQLDVDAVRERMRPR
jgi:hypothetical protein